MPAPPLTNFEKQEYCKNESRFNGVYCRDNLPKTIKNGAYVINLDEYADAGTHWIKFMEKKPIKTSIFRIQADSSIMCGYFCIGFIDFMLTGKSLTDFTGLFSPYDFKKNDDIILSYFK